MTELKLYEGHKKMMVNSDSYSTFPLPLVLVSFYSYRFGTTWNNLFLEPTMPMTIVMTFSWVWWSPCMNFLTDVTAVTANTSCFSAFIDLIILTT